MKVYIVQTIGDSTIQCGMSLSKETAEKVAKEINEQCKDKWWYQPYWVEEFELNEDYTEFD